MAKERNGAVLNRLIKTFSYADKVDGIVAQINCDIGELKSTISMMLSDIKTLQKDLDAIRSFMVNDSKSPYVVKIASIAKPKIVTTRKKGPRNSVFEKGPRNSVFEE